MSTLPPPRFITFEGIDGAGKSTHLHWFAQRLKQLLDPYGKQLVLTREPGGTALSEQLRKLVLKYPMDLETETLLIFAARKEHIVQVIRPALARGDWVLSDRFTDATFAYQGGGRGLATDKLNMLEYWVQAELQPNLTLLFDLNTNTAQARLAKARQPDKFEAESSEFFQRTRQAYLQRAQAQPQRFIVINAAQSIELVRQEIETKVFPLLLI